MDLHDVTVEKAQAHAQGLILLSLKPSDWSQSHERPGQYVMLKGPGDEKPRPLALASAPGATPIQLLIKADGDRAEALLGLKTGDLVQCSSPAGPGYPIEKAAGAPLWLIATGSALAPIKTALDALLAGGMPSSTQLFLGARSPADLPFSEDLDRYRAAGVEVQIAYSQPESGEGTWVQALLEQPPTAPGQTVVFVCGQPEMMDAAQALLVAHGVPAEQVFRNF